MDSNEQMRIFGKRLRTLRKKAQRTQADLAERANISCVYVNKLERGLAVPSIHVLCRLAECLGADVSSLFTVQDALADNREQFQEPSPYMALFLAAKDAQTRRLVFESDEDSIPLPPNHPPSE
jgi:transcriptional regulator with XRE-family HTH domain